MGKGAWASPDDLSSIPKIHMIEGENRLPSHCLLAAHVYMQIQMLDELDR